MCYEDLENTIAKYCLKTGTNIADLTSTEYMDGIVLPKLTEAMMKMLWRFTWFGDKDAANIDGSGQITDGLNVELFKTCDGFFKRLFAICAENSGQHTVISANSEASYALQKSKMKELGLLHLCLTRCLKMRIAVFSRSPDMQFCYKIIM